MQSFYLHHINVLAGVVSTLAGHASAGSVDGTGSQAAFNLPVGITLNSAGDVFVGDYENFVVRKITSSGDDNIIDEFVFWSNMSITLGIPWLLCGVQVWSARMVCLRRGELMELGPWLDSTWCMTSRSPRMEWCTWLMEATI